LGRKESRSLPKNTIDNISAGHVIEQGSLTRRKKKGGKPMEGKFPRVEVQNIDKLSVNFKAGSAKISFEVMHAGPDLLKLIYMQATACPMNVIIESPQAEMDLVIQQVNVKTGVVKDEEKD
jgi:hypothetical protein